MRLIDADALINYFCVRCGAACNLEDQCCSSIDAVENAPTINPDDLRPHGRWIQHNKENNNWVECSECNTVGSPFWKCCPVCTAMMEGKHEDI